MFSSIWSQLRGGLPPPDGRPQTDITTLGSTDSTPGKLDARYSTCAPHRALFAVFLRNSIKRVAISGTTLPGVALADDVGGFDTVCNTHTDILLRRVIFCQIQLHCSIGNGDLLPRNTFNRSLRYPIVSGGT